MLEWLADHPHLTADQVAAGIRRLFARFETRTGDNHHHLVCRTCGRTEDVDCVHGSAPCLEPSATAGFEVDEAEVVFWGQCPDCIAESTTSQEVPA